LILANLFRIEPTDGKEEHGFGPCITWRHLFR
jgi:hypothetical protein